MKPPVKPVAHLRVEWLPKMPWKECPRSRGIRAHLPWNAQIKHQFGHCSASSKRPLWPRASMHRQLTFPTACTRLHRFWRGSTAPLIRSNLGWDVPPPPKPPDPDPLHPQPQPSPPDRVNLSVPEMKCQITEHETFTAAILPQDVVPVTPRISAEIRNLPLSGDLSVLG